MKFTKKITNLLLDGKPRTADEIAEELCLTSEQMRSAMNSLRRHSAIKRTPISYELTQVGKDHAVKTAARKEEERLLHNQKQRAYRERLRVEEQLRKKPVVDQALRARPALESAWGAMHA